MKKIAKLLMICLCILGLIGCANKNPAPEEKQAGEDEATKQDIKQDMKQGMETEPGRGVEYFKEEKIPLPEEAVNIQDVRKSGDSILIASSEGKQKSSFIWKTDNNGMSWEQVLDLPEELQYSVVSEALFLDDSSLICSVRMDVLKEESDPATIQKKYYKVSLAGEWTEFSSDMSERDIRFLQYYDSLIYGTNQRDGISVFDASTGALKASFDKISGQINGFCVMNEKIFVEGIDNIRIFDSRTGEPLDTDKILCDALDPVLLKGNRNSGNQGFTDKIVCDAGNGFLYYINADALYQYDFAESEFKEVLYGKNHRYADEEMVLMDISPVGDHELSIVTYQNNIQDLKEPVKPEMCWYTYVPEGTVGET